jgi:hypothetical protein
MNNNLALLSKKEQYDISFMDLYERKIPSASEDHVLFTILL